MFDDYYLGPTIKAGLTAHSVASPDVEFKIVRG